MVEALAFFLGLDSPSFVVVTVSVSCNLDDIGLDGGGAPLSPWSFAHSLGNSLICLVDLDFASHEEPEYTPAWICCHLG